MNIVRTPLRALAALLLATLSLVLAAASAQAAELPDPMARGNYAVTTLDPFRGGLVDLQEPSSTGGGTTGAAAAVTLQIRGSMYYPSDRTTPSPVLVLVHGNHTQCDSGTSPFCTAFKRNDRGYAYLGENLASHGYTVVSLDQDQLMAFQDSQTAGMHQRRLLIAATLDMLTKADAQALPLDANSNIGDRFVGRLDMERIGLMGHSRGGDAVASFINWNRTRPAPGRRYNLRGVISLAPVDYERSTPFGTPFLAIEPLCDGDVSNLQGARMYERGQYALPGDPFPRIQESVHGGNHNFFNTVWAADTPEDSTTADPACGPRDATSIRLSTGPYDSVNRGSGDPALMGDQQKVGLALMGSFFRRYVGGETAFDPYVTGELSATDDHREIPATACPTSTNGARMACDERVMTSYFPGAAERRDVITPDPDNPLTVSALGTALTSSGFANPYTADGGVLPQPLTTATGLDWCNPEPDHFTPGNIGLGALPTAKKGCPLPGVAALGGQNGARENAPDNRSYGLQFAAAWNDPVRATGRPATIATRIPAGSGDVSGFKALGLAAAVNFFDPRNPARTGEALWNPATLTQDFTIAVTDASGATATVSAADERYGNALHPTVGNITARVHIILNQIRVPLSDFAAQGVDLTRVRKLELLFGEAGKPATGSIELADVRFQEPVGGSQVLADGASATASGGGVQPIDLVEPAARTTVEKAGQVLGATTVAATATSCRDTTAPTARITAKGKRVVRGVAADSGCGAKVASVQVTVAKGVGGGRYRYLTPKGALTKARKSAGAKALVATGTTKWSLKLGRLPAGTYRVAVRVIDASGNARTTKAVKLVVS